MYIYTTDLDVMSVGVVGITSIEMVHGVLVGVHGCYQRLSSLMGERETLYVKQRERGG